MLRLFEYDFKSVFEETEAAFSLFSEHFVFQSNLSYNLMKVWQKRTKLLKEQNTNCSLILAAELQMNEVMKQNQWEAPTDQ